LGGLTEKFEGAQLVPGPSPDATKMPQIEPAKIAAANMQKAILDQIDETDGHIALRKTILEMCMLGHGVIKGPFSIEKTIHDWKKNEDTGIYPNSCKNARNFLGICMEFIPRPRC